MIHVCSLCYTECVYLWVLGYMYSFTETFWTLNGYNPLIKTCLKLKKKKLESVYEISIKSISFYF